MWYNVLIFRLLCVIEVILAYCFLAPNVIEVYAFFLNMPILISNIVPSFK